MLKTKGPGQVSSGEQVVVVVLVLEGGRRAGGVGVVAAAVGCKIRMAGWPFGRMTDSTDGRVPRPSHKLGSCPRIWPVVRRGNAG